MSLNEVRSKNSLVIGIGNPLRCDDGVGHYIAECIEGKSLNDVKVWTTQQLQVEDLERMLEYKQVVLVDASMEGPPVDLRPVEKSSSQALSSSHHLSPQVFVNLADSIYHKDLPMHLCSVKGVCFDMGDEISTTVLQRAQEAVKLICSLLKR